MGNVQLSNIPQDSEAVFPGLHAQGPLDYPYDMTPSNYSVDEIEAAEVLMFV